MKANFVAPAQKICQRKREKVEKRTKTKRPARRSRPLETQRWGFALFGALLIHQPAIAFLAHLAACPGAPTTSWTHSVSAAVPGCSRFHGLLRHRKRKRQEAV